MSTSQQPEGFCHTGSPTLPDLRPPFYDGHRLDIIDAPDFLPCGYHFNSKTFGDAQTQFAAHRVRPGTFR